MSARRRTLRHVCRALPSRTRSSSPRARESYSAISSSWRTSAPKDLKGIAGPVRAWAALRPASVESRFEALHASGLTELVGREEELELLLRRWSKAKTGEGQVVLLSGEAGIGKSRLTAALLERLAASRTRACAISARRSTPTAPFIRSSARWNVPPDLRTTTRRKRSSTSSMRCSRRPRPRTQDAALFAEMLSLPNDGRYPALDLAPEQRRQRTLEALTTQVAKIGKPATGADDLRGCALDRPDEPGSVRSSRGPDSQPFARC